MKGMVIGMENQDRFLEMLREMVEIAHAQQDRLTKEEIETHLNPVAYIGRCPEQVEEFLTGEIAPVLKKYAGALDGI